jgi:hypothetical protein
VCVCVCGKERVTSHFPRPPDIAATIARPVEFSLVNTTAPFVTSGCRLKKVHTIAPPDNFKHCQACNMCIDITQFEKHNCKEGKYQSDCPVCQECMFSSRSASHEMPCGHAIHWHCFRQLAAHDSRCPVCKKTAETRERMLPTWTVMAQSVLLQPIPPEMARVVNTSVALFGCAVCELPVV